MKKIFLIIKSCLLFLILVNVARAEQVYLSCKFQSGYVVYNLKEREEIKKGSKQAYNFDIILDTKNKKIIEAPSFNPKLNNTRNNKENPGGFSNYSSIWLENEIKWEHIFTYEEKKFNHSIYQNLNRKNNIVKYHSILILDGEHQEVRRTFSCSKESKKS
jgi:hypothetical protein